eukprot:scaffold426_cov319-Pavlova_lutheri.AAC.37
MNLIESPCHARVRQGNHGRMDDKLTVPYHQRFNVKFLPPSHHLVTRLCVARVASPLYPHNCACKFPR